MKKTMKTFALMLAAYSIVQSVDLVIYMLVEMYVEDADDVYAFLYVLISYAQIICLGIYGWYLAKCELKKEISIKKYNNFFQAFFEQYGIALIVIAALIYMFIEGNFYYSGGIIYGRQWSPDLGRYQLLMDGNIIGVFIERNFFGYGKLLFYVPLIFLVYAITKSRALVKNRCR